MDAPNIGAAEKCAFYALVPDQRGQDPQATWNRKVLKRLILVGRVGIEPTTIGLKVRNPIWPMRLIYKKESTLHLGQEFA
jgi:hypothetical protein